MNVDLIFEGGGVLGISYAGAFKALEEKRYRVQRCAGTSAGSIMAALILAGYTSKEITNILFKTDFSIFMEKTKLGKALLVGKPLSLIFDKGLFNSRSIEEWVDEQLRRKGISKFKDIASAGESRLKIIAADITKRKMLILPDDLTGYGIDPLEFSIAKAVRMSCAIPFFFTPVELKYGKSISYIVDGGLLSNFPIWIFDTEGPRWPAFGIKIKDLESYTSSGKTDIISYIKDIVGAPINQDETNFIRNKDYVRTIIIDYNGNIKFSDFDKVNEHISALYENGYQSTLKFLNGWNFNRYAELYGK
jgi:NTE family protein